MVLPKDSITEFLAFSVNKMFLATYLFVSVLQTNHSRNTRSTGPAPSVSRSTHLSSARRSSSCPGRNSSAGPAPAADPKAQGRKGWAKALTKMAKLPSPGDEKRTSKKLKIVNFFLEHFNFLKLVFLFWDHKSSQTDLKILKLYW